MMRKFMKTGDFAMKKMRLLLVLLILACLLTACGLKKPQETEPVVTMAPTEAPTQAPTEAPTVVVPTILNPSSQRPTSIKVTRPTQPVQTQPVETQPVETQPVQTQPVQTQPPVVETQAPTEAPTEAPTLPPVYEPGLSVEVIPEVMIDDNTKVQITYGIPAEIPQELLNAGYLTPEIIREILLYTIWSVDPNVNSIATFDATLVYKEGDQWFYADEAHFPADGFVPVLLPYPKGTDMNTQFTALHMFSSSAFGKTPGDVELLAPVNTEDGILVYVTGLSPIMLGWVGTGEVPEAPEATEPTEIPTEAPTTAPTEAPKPTETKAEPAEDEAEDPNVVLIVVIAVVVLAAAGAAAWYFLIYKKKKPAAPAEDAEKTE